MSLLQDQNYVSEQQPMPVDDMSTSSSVQAVTGETVSLYYSNSGTRTIDAGQAAGTAVMGQLTNKNILDVNGSDIATYADSSLSFTGNCFTTQVKFPSVAYKDIKDKTWANKLSSITANFANGEYCVDYTSGAIYGKKATTTSSLTSVAYKINLSQSNVYSGSTGLTDDSAFTPGTSTVTAAGYFADETATDSVDEGDIGAARMTLDRKQINASEFQEDTVFANASYLTLQGFEVDDPTALATMTEGDVGNGKVDLSGRLIVTKGTEDAGEDLSNDLIGVLPKPIAGTTYTGTRLQDLSFTTSNLKATHGNVLRIEVLNTTGSTRYFQLHNTATTPAGGATAQHFYIVPPNSQAILGPAELSDAGLPFTTGIAYANSSTASTYTAGTAGDLLLNIRYI